MTLVGTYLAHRPSPRVHHRVTPFRSVVVRCGRWVLSTVRGSSWGKTTAKSSSGVPCGSWRMRRYHLVKPLIPRRLVHHDDGSVIPSIHSLVREHFTVTARFRLLLPRTGSFLASHPASWIEVQSLPRGYHFLVPIHQVRTCTSHQQISCVAVHLQPASPHAFACFRLTDRTRHMMLERGAQSNWAKTSET